MESEQAIRAQGFNIEQLRQIIGHSSLKEKTQFIHASDNVLELVDGFVKLMSKEEIEFGAEPLAALQVAGMMIFMLHHSDLESTLLERTQLMQRCFEYMACTEETHVHQLCTQILSMLSIDESQTMLNMICCCRTASPLSTMAQVVCTCLLWAMLDKLTDLGFETYRLRAYEEIMMAISMVNPLFHLQNYLHSLNLIVRVISALLVTGPYGCTDNLRTEVGVSEQMLELPSADAAVLFRWLNTIGEELRDEMQHQDGHVQERMVILETSCELMTLVHSHLEEYYQRIYSINEFDDDGFVSGEQGDNEDDFAWLL